MMTSVQTGATTFRQLTLFSAVFALAVPMAYSQTQAESENMALLAHHPLDGRPSYTPMPHLYEDRWILFKKGLEVNFTFNSFSHNHRRSFRLTLNTLKSR